MKKIFSLTLFVALFATVSAFAQADKSQRPSPPAFATFNNTSGLELRIDYSQPSVKGRTLGQDIAPFGKVWRTGANEATVFTVNKDVKIEGKALPAGKYSLYTIPGKDEWTIIFNRKWNQWGTVYSEAEDALRVTVKPKKASPFVEKMSFSIKGEKAATVTLLWADTQVDFTVK